MLTVVLLCYLNFASCRSIPDLNDVEEIQHAVCRVATEEVQASANASITRQLKGVCSTRAMNQRMDEMQRILFVELQVLKLMLQGAGFTTPKPFPSTKSKETFLPHDEDYDYADDVEDSNKARLVKNLEYFNSTHKYTVLNEQFPRSAEILKSNETIVTTDLGKAFVYYWKIPNVNSTFKNDLYFTSPVIDYLDSKLFVKCSTKHLGSKYVSLELLEPNVFKNNYRIVLLGADEKEDLNSPLFKPKMRKVFRIAKETFLTFAIDDSVIVKLMVYLN